MNHQKEPGRVSVGLGMLAVVGLLFGVASLATLVVVVSIARADLLSVVALSLAVLAFAAQLIIYIVQASDSASSSRRALELHTQTSSLLAELRERTGTTQRSVDTINERLLAALIGKATVDSEARDPVTLARRVARSYTEAAETTTEHAPAMHEWPPPLPSSEADRIQRELLKWPSADEVPEIEDAVTKLNEAQQGSLYNFAMDLKEFTVPGVAAGPGLSNAGLLDGTGLIEPAGAPDKYTLTPRGRQLSRFLTAEGDAPPWLGGLAEIRGRLEERYS